jgi:asparagine synthase (glutamine-hydrolysing)
MCGIAGFWSGEGAPGAELEALGRRMGMALSHRGPDGSGEWAEPEAGLLLAHRRLSILDLSPEGAQPMVSGSGRYVMSFNGEVYNFGELRRELEQGGARFRGHSDTEVMLAAFDAWGVQPAVRRFVGMFAFALWDRRERTLSLVRDRLGIKPLFYGWCGRTLLFGSELKALTAHPAFSAGVDRGALALLLRHDCVPAPYSIYQGIFKLPPGTVLTLRSAAERNAEPAAFWSAREVAERGAANPFGGSDQEAVDELDGLLREAVRLRMIADVPLGAFLSGGVDSSTVVALMQAQSERPVRTFSVGFHDEGYDEAGQARAVAAHLGTDHTELYVSPQDALAVVPRLPEMFDEPFADSSQIPTFLVSRLARQQVTVSLSGDGGDELFGGYNRHVWGPRVWRRMAPLPLPLRRAAARALTARTPESWDRLYGRAERVLPAALRQRTPGYKLHKLAGVLGSGSAEEMYRRLASHWRNPPAVVPGAVEPPTALTDSSRWAAVPGVAETMMFLDLVTYLPDDILTKVDRASMAVSLEARVPLLDHRVVEFAWRLPLRMKLREGEGKWVLRRVLDRYVPRELVERPKMGFAVPLAAWLRGPLRDWAEALLDPRVLRTGGFFDPAPVRKAWAEHLSGADRGEALWDVLMFQAWLQARTAPAAAAAAA